MASLRLPLAAIWASYPTDLRREELEGDWATALIYRPISILLTPPALWLRLAPSTITLLRVVFAGLLPITAWFGGAHAYLGVAVMAMLSPVLDCLDGNVARVASRCSAPGALFDGFADHLCWFGLYAAVGLLVRREASGFVGAHGLELALIMFALLKLHQGLRNSYAYVFRERPELVKVPKSTRSALRWAELVYVGLDGLYPFGVLAAGATRAMWLLLVAVACYGLTIFMGAVALVFSKAVRRGTPAGWTGR